ANPDIFLLDEVLAVGDAKFQKKCYNLFTEFKKQEKTVIIASHNLALVKHFCNKNLLLDEGKQLMFGNTKEVLSYYKKMYSPRTVTW
ncbi:unnamed protein product, partial [marine sediment metagenome]